MNNEKGIYERREGRWEARFKTGVNDNGRAIYRSVYAKTKDEVIAKRRAILGEDDPEDIAVNTRLNLLILGAGTHGHDVYEIAKEMHVFHKISFLDDNATGENIIGKCADVLKFKQQYLCAFIAIGDNAKRKKYAEILRDYRFLIPSIVSPAANVSSKAEIGEGVAILPQATVSEAKIGDFCILAQNSLVHGGAEVGQYSHIDSAGIVTKGKKVPEATKVEIREVY